MKAFSKSFAILVCTLTLFAGLVRAADSVGGEEWKTRMRAMLGNVLVLFPFAFDEAKFNDPANKQLITSSLESLGKYSSELKKHTSHVKPEKGAKIDPSFAFIADSFEQDVSMAQLAFQTEGSRSQAQRHIRSAVSKCMMCHTQSTFGPELKLDQFQNQFKSLSDTDRFTALVVTRQFDEGLKQFDQIVAGVKAKKIDQVAFDRSVRVALSVVVRVLKDPNRTRKLIDEVASSEGGSPMMQNDLKGWKKSVTSWLAEKPTQLNTDRALFDEAQRLTRASRQDNQGLDVFESKDVSLLRASGLLHDLLTNYPASPLRAESLMLLASHYQTLSGFSIWGLGEEYLGACIHENPHSEAGEKCFSEYNESVTMGYTGSSGTHIPKAVRDHITRMKELATRKTPAGKKPKAM